MKILIKKIVVNVFGMVGVVLVASVDIKMFIGMLLIFTGYKLEEFLIKK